METLRNYLESMFKRYPRTPEAERAKAELWQMMEDKYGELISEGKKENEAVGIVISEFGDLEEVADTLGIATMLQKTDNASDSQSASDGARAPEPEIFSDYRESAGTQSENTAWQSSGPGADSGNSGAWWTWHNENSYNQTDTGEFIYRAVRSVLSVYWPTVTCIYLCWSFLTFHWWITWIIWPLAAILCSVLKRLILGDVTARDGQTYKNRLIAAVLDSYWPCVVFVYFAVSFLSGAWAVTWLIFIIAPFVRNLLKRTAIEREPI